MKVIRYISFFLVFIITFACSHLTEQKDGYSEKSRLKQINEKGILRVVTDFNSTSYFIYRGQPMGYQYELLQELANHLGVKLEVIVNNNTEEKFKLLEDGKVDLIASNLIITKERRQNIEFTVPHAETRQVLVQRKQMSFSQPELAKLQDSLIRSQVTLARKSVYVPRNSTYAKRLYNLSDEIGDSIYVKEVEESVESLIDKVSSGEINYTVCDEIEGKVYENFYGNIDIETPISFSQSLAWGVPKGATDLKFAIDVWLTDFKKSKKYAQVYRKYFENRRSAQFVDKEYFESVSGKISPFDAAIRECSEEAGLDWRFVASVIYQESRFNPQAKSWAGAYGLMQMMPSTAERFGVGPESSPVQQIRGGVKFIMWLDDKFSFIDDPVERKKFVLASYNIGLGHVMDARALAQKNGKDPDKWDNNVVDFLLSKSDPLYYTDPVVKHGYCKGTETFKYVAEVMQRYEHYKNLIQR